MEVSSHQLLINQKWLFLVLAELRLKQVFMGDKYESRIMLPLSLSYDHRVIDGAEGGSFLCTFKRKSWKRFCL